MRVSLSLFFLFPLIGLTAGCSTSTSASVKDADAVRSKGTAQVKKETPPPTSAIPDRREFPVDESVSPCEDFYAYTCNKVRSSFKLRDDRSRHTFAFNDSAERILNAKKAYLAELSTLAPKTDRTKTLKNVYVACMDKPASQQEERAAVKRISDEVATLKDNVAFQKYVAARIATAQTSLLDFGDIANQDDPEWQDLYLLAGMRSLPERSYYDKADVTKDLEALIADFLTTIGDGENAAARAKAVVDFEHRNSMSYPLPAEFRDLVSKRTSITKAQLIKRYPALRLKSFLKKVPERTHIRDFTPDNFAFWNTALKKEPLQTLKDTYLFHSITPYLDDAYPEYFNKSFAFRNKHLGGPKTRPVRAERCTTMVMHRFLKELDAEMLDKLFPKFPEEQFVKLVERVRSSILDGIENSDWLSPSSKKEAKAKMTKARLQVVKPRNDAEWDFNPPAEYASNTPYANMDKLDENLTARTLKRMNEKRNRNRWSMGPLTINAYYSGSDNKFVMPIGILQYPFYDPSLPDYVNLGAVGGVVGHELGHGIDDKGSKYDADGKLRQWFTDADLAEFTKRGSKLIKQFDDAGHNGKLTLGENIGDFVGLTFGYRTAFPEGKGSLEAKRAFFTQWGRVWCNVMRPKAKELQLKTNPHSLGWARVNEQMKQQPGFQEAFGCKDTDPMVLKDRVKIW